MLLPFILGLAMDPDLHEAFLQDPAVVVMARDDLSDTDKEVLLSCDPTRMATTLAAEVEGNASVSPDDARRKLMMMMMMMMPNPLPTPTPWVYVSQNITGFYWELKGNALTLTVHGTRLKGVYGCVEIRNGAMRIPGQIGNVHGSQTGESVIITFTLPNDIADGTYWVVAASGENVSASSSTQPVAKAPMSCDFSEVGLGYEIRRSGGRDLDHCP